MSAEAQTSEGTQTMPLLPNIEIITVFNGWVIQQKPYGSTVVVVEKLKDRDNMAVLMTQVSRILGDKGDN